MNPHRVSKSVAQRRAKAEVVLQTSRFGHLPTLAEMQAKPRAMPKFTSDHVPATTKSPVAARLARAKKKQAALGSDRRKLSRWANAVKARDQWFDRYDGRAVLKTAELHPRRGEAHHIVPRGNLALRYDVRNGITLSLESHAKVEAGQLRIVGTKFFTVDGTRHVDATFPVTFVEVR